MTLHIGLLLDGSRNGVPESRIPSSCSGILLHIPALVSGRMVDYHVSCSIADMTMLIPWSGVVLSCLQCIVTNIPIVTKRVPRLWHKAYEVDMKMTPSFCFVPSRVIADTSVFHKISTTYYQTTSWANQGPHFSLDAFSCRLVSVENPTIAVTQLDFRSLISCVQPPAYHLAISLPYIPCDLLVHDFPSD